MLAVDGICDALDETDIRSPEPRTRVRPSSFGTPALDRDIRDKSKENVSRNFERLGPHDETRAETEEHLKPTTKIEKKGSLGGHTDIHGRLTRPQKANGIRRRGSGPIWTDWRPWRAWPAPALCRPPSLSLPLYLSSSLVPRPLPPPPSPPPLPPLPRCRQ